MRVDPNIYGMKEKIMETLLKQRRDKIYVLNPIA